MRRRSTSDAGSRLSLGACSLRAFSFVGRRCEEACTLVFLSRTLSAKINQRLVSTEDLRYSASLQIVKHRFN